MKIKIFIVIGIFAHLQLSIFNCHAQQSINTSGGNISGTSGSVSYSIGQIEYQTYSSNYGSMSEGVQQPYEIFEISIADYEGAVIDCQVFPNPTTDLIQLRIANYELLEFKDINFSISDINGKQIMQHELMSESTEISMKNLAQGTYLIHIRVDSNVAKGFKIIKN